MLVVTLLAAAAALASADPAPTSRDEALARYGAPAARVATPDGGERLRWAAPRDSVLATMDLTTVEVDRQGKVMRVERRLVKMRDPAAW